MVWNKDQTITVTPPKHPKKITGTRFASILGLNKWNTPFKTWCAITRTYEEPFKDTIYTTAGKIIEPKQAEFMKNHHFMPNLVTPTDVYGTDYFRKTRGDFFPDSSIFGGMWDYLLVNEAGKPVAVLEMKTTVRTEDWKDDIPEYYALQAALYAHLLGVDRVIMVASFLSESDLANPECFIPSNSNTVCFPFSLSERYPEFTKYISMAEAWWRKHVEGGTSPKYSERADADILKELRVNTVSPDTELEQLVNEAEALKSRLDAIKAQSAKDEKRLKLLTDKIKEIAVSRFRDGDRSVSIAGPRYEWVTTRVPTVKIDKDGLQKAGLLELYSSSEITYRLTPTAKKEA